MYFMLKMFVFRWKYPILNSEPERTLHDFTHLFWLDGGFNPFEKYYTVLRIKVPFNIFLCYNDDFVDVHPMVDRIIPKLTPKKRMAFQNEKILFPYHKDHPFFGQHIRSYNLHKSTILGRFKFDPDLHLMPKSKTLQVISEKKKKSRMKIHQPGKPGKPYVEGNFVAGFRGSQSCLKKIGHLAKAFLPENGFTTHQPGWTPWNPHLYHEDVAIPYPNHLPQLLP